MTITRRVSAFTILAVTALSLTSGTATAAPHIRHLNPPVTVIQCEEGGGWVASDIRERREFCLGGEFNDRYVTWE
ncbi:hypothetical protein GCM10009738_88000 [Kitasatospora viridis]|uniref:hypothetical protein n=1 Tax=Kitasatospora viridis TaxID=281105 RepID=UPI0031E1EAEE